MIYAVRLKDLGQDKIDKIRQLYASGEWSYVRLAKEMGVGVRQIRTATKGVAKYKTPFEERFWANVDITDDANACWRWNGTLDECGYGKCGTEYKGTRRAPRIAYMLAWGDIPEGKVVRHTCDVPACVNPAHLILGDKYDDVHDMIERGRARIGVKRINAIQALEARFFEDLRIPRHRVAMYFDVAGSTIRRATKKDRFELQRQAMEIAAKLDAALLANQTLDDDA